MPRRRRTLLAGATIGANSRYWLRVAIAFAVAPLTPVLLTALYVYGDTHDRAWVAPVPAEFAVAVAVLAALYGYPGMVLPGMPLFGWLLATRRTRRLAYAATGGASALVAVPAVMLASVFIYETGISPGDASAVFFGLFTPGFLAVPLLGALAGYCFWLIARPDRRPKP